MAARTCTYNTGTQSIHFMQINMHNCVDFSRAGVYNSIDYNV